MSPSPTTPGQSGATSVTTTERRRRGGGFVAVAAAFAFLVLLLIFTPLSINWGDDEVADELRTELAELRKDVDGIDIDTNLDEKAAASFEEAKADLAAELRAENQELLREIRRERLQEVRELRKEIRELRDDRRSVENAVVEDRLSDGWRRNQLRVGNDVDWSLNKSDRTGGSFGDRIRSEADLRRYLRNNPTTRRHLRDSLPQREHARALSGKGFVPFQSLVGMCYSGNMYYVGNTVQRGGRTCVEAGDVVWAYVDSRDNVVWDASVRSDCANPGFTSAPRPEQPGEKPLKPAPPKEDKPEKPQPPKKDRPDKPVKETPDKPKPPGNPDEGPEQPTPSPTPEPTMVEVCNPETKEIIEVPYSEADEYEPVDSPLCDEQPTPTPTPEPTPTPTPTPEPTPTPTPTPTPEPTPTPTPEPTPTPTPEPEPTCPPGTDREGEPRGNQPCKVHPGTPDEGPDVPPVQDNDPVHEAPTDGYNPGDAEENDEQQGDPCSGDSCGHDPTDSGTEVDDSEQGGGAPGGDVVTPDEQPDQNNQPDDSGQPNPDHDGSQPTENPDEGTSNPDDNQAEEPEDPADPGANDNEGDPLDDMDLP